MNVSPGFFNIWRFIRVFIDERTLAKIEIDKAPCVNEMWDLMDKNQVEKIFGGNCEIKKDNFWPPFIPNNNFGHEPT